MSYEIAATGLNAVNEQLDGISNNIANSGTVGYKSMTTQFSAMYAGTQAMGVSVAGSAQSISTGGSMVSTGNALDLAINDDGFFVMCDSAGNISYTRAGSFVTDKNGYIVNASGDYLQGYPVDDSGTLQTGTVTDIQIKTGNIQNGSVTAEKLDTVYATKIFVDEMNAELARVNTLAASKVDANYVAANYATIGSLNAANANIANLQANKLTTSVITTDGTLGIRCTTLVASSTGNVYGTFRCGALIVDGTQAFWKTTTISGTTINYLGR